MPSSAPLVTIFALCHNHAPYLVECLESLRIQEYPNVECFLLNNTKDDGSERIARQWIERTGYPCTFIQNDSPRSVVENLNYLLGYARGTYLVGIACDDSMLPGRLERQVAEFERRGEKYGCIYGEMQLMDPESRILGNFYANLRWPAGVPLPEGTLLDYHSRSCFVGAPAAMYRCAALRAVGGFDPRFAIEDWPLYLKFGRRGIRFAGLGKPLVNYRVIPGSLGKVVSEQRIREMWLLFREYRDVLVPSKSAIRKWSTFAEQLRQWDPAGARMFRRELRQWAGWRYYITRLSGWRYRTGKPK